jgi:transcriptional regulator GlxA family with amidase domain
VELTTLTTAAEAEKDHATGGVAANHHLQRAEEYILAHLRDAFSLHDLAEAAGTSLSTLLRTFNTHHGVSPMQYVKLIRLEAVRRSLLDAGLPSGTVCGVASEYGFRQLGRLSAEYRKVYGELPSVTLRRHRHRLSDTKGL